MSQRVKHCLKMRSHWRYSNAIFEQHIGKGFWVVLPKSGKPLGPLTSVHPIVLLNSVHKIVSIITHSTFVPRLMHSQEPVKLASNKGEAVQTLYGRRACSFQLC